MLPESNRIIGFSQLHSSLVPLYCAPPTRMHHTHTQCIEANLLCLTNPKRKETTSKCKSNTLSSNKRKQQCMEEEKIHSHSTNKHNLLALLHSPVIQICISSFFTFFFVCVHCDFNTHNTIPFVSRNKSLNHFHSVLLMEFTFFVVVIFLSLNPGGKCEPSVRLQLRYACFCHGKSTLYIAFGAAEIETRPSNIHI